jgi:hypothetical protein
MELLGQIGDRQIFYCNLREDPDCLKNIRFQNPIAFTIADYNDKDVLPELVTGCLDMGVCYTNSVGEIASLTEDYFDDEIVIREIKVEEKTGVASDYEATPMTCFHKNFDDGFWFSAVVAKQIINEIYVESNQLICVDCTSKKVRGHLVRLVGMINEGWIPSDEEVQIPVYDS